MADALSKLVKRHEAFWCGGEVEVPLLGTSRWPYVMTQDWDWGFGRESGLLEPEMLDVERFLPQYEAWFDAHGSVVDDLFWSASPPRSVPWFESIVGCPPRYSLPGGSMSGEPYPGDWRAFDPESVLADNPWLEKLLEFTQALVDLSAGRFPVSPIIARGPWDIAGAMRGHTDLYTDLYDCPADAAELAAKLGRVWVEVTRRLARIVPPWHGGYLSMWGVWAPEFTIWPQNDASVSVSPGMYREVMAPADRMMTQAWKCATFHMHSAGLQLVDEIVSFLEGRALNVVFDPVGPSVTQLLPLLGRLQSSGVPLHLLAFASEDARCIVDNLGPRGLAIVYQPKDV